jgi:hypothetical protein
VAPQTRTHPAVLTCHIARVRPRSPPRGDKVASNSRQAAANSLGCSSGDRYSTPDCHLGGLQADNFLAQHALHVAARDEHLRVINFY